MTNQHNNIVFALFYVYLYSSANMEDIASNKPLQEVYSFLRIKT